MLDIDVWCNRCCYIKDYLQFQSMNAVLKKHAKMHNTQVFFILSCISVKNMEGKRKNNLIQLITTHRNITCSRNRLFLFWSLARSENLKSALAKLVFTSTPVMAC